MSTGLKKYFYKGSLAEANGSACTIQNLFICFAKNWNSLCGLFNRNTFDLRSHNFVIMAMKLSCVLFR